MDIARMRVFACVADHGSVTRAARVLRTTQSAVSRHVTTMETEVGHPLFHRTGRGVVLTDLGQRVLARVRTVLAEVAQIGLEAGAETGDPAGEVMIGMLPTIAPSIAARLHGILQRRHPRIRLGIIDGVSGQLEAALSDGQLDMALLFRDAAEQRAGDQPIGLLHSYLVGPRGDVLTSAPLIDFARLSRLPLVVPRNPHGLRTALDQFANQAGIQLKIAIEASSVAIQLAIVANPANGTYSVASHHAIADGLRHGWLQAARIVAPGIDRRLTLVESRKRPATLATRQVGPMLRAIALEVMEIDRPPAVPG